MAAAGVQLHTTTTLRRWLQFRPKSWNSSNKLLRSIHHKFYRSSLTRLVCSLANDTPISSSTIDGNDDDDDASNSTFSGLEEEAAMMIGYITGAQNKATQVAHQIWKRVVRKGDAVVDATCGNGYDTLAMLKMVSDESCMGRVFGMDIQENALETTMSLLDASVKPREKELVKLYPICHSKMEEVVPSDVSVRLVAFNLGYLPGGDKTVITRSETTLLGLEAAARVLGLGGLISVVAYVGHPGGREEFERVQDFVSGLPVDSWNCCKLQMLNRPLAPILVFLFKRTSATELSCAMSSLDRYA